MTDLARELLRTPPRSWLFVPGDRVAELLPKAERSNADAIIVDLEDAVAPQRKERAREDAALQARAVRRKVPLLLRVNAQPAAAREADVAAAIRGEYDGVVLPKTERAVDVARLAKLLDRHRRRECVIVPLVETARGLLAAFEIASAERVVAVAFGGEDLAADIGVPRSRSGLELFHARGEVVLAAAAAGRPAIDTPSLEVRDLAAVRRDARRSRRLGFAGKLVIHPAHVPIVNAAFAPSEEEVAAARAVLRAVEAAGPDAGIVVVEGRMVDRPVILNAQRVLARAARSEGREPQEAM